MARCSCCGSLTSFLHEYKRRGFVKSLLGYNTKIHNSHFHSLHLDAPRVRGLVQRRLHHVGDTLTLGEDVAQILRAQDVPAGMSRFATVIVYL
jgi:hypothetical protein